MTPPHPPPHPPSHSTPHRRPYLRKALPVLLVAVLLGVAGWSLDRLVDRRDRAEAAARETAQCLRLAEAIEHTRRSATLNPLTGGDPLQTRQLQQLIQAAADQAGIDPDQAVRSIRPRPGQRLADGPYTEHAAELKLQHVSRQQLVAFMHALMRDNPGLHVRSLRLVVAGQNGQQGDRWNADPLTLTYLIYQPVSQEPGARRVTQR